MEGLGLHTFFTSCPKPLLLLPFQQMGVLRLAASAGRMSSLGLNNIVLISLLNFHSDPPSREVTLGFLEPCKVFFFLFL